MNGAQLQAGLEQLQAHWRDNNARAGEFHYAGAADFVLREGRRMALAPDNPYPRGMPRHCFHNSIMLALCQGLRYVEGYGTNDVIGIPVHHAWCLDARGRVIEPTWPADLTGKTYMGVEFSPVRADDATWNGDAAILDDWQRDWPIFKQPWAPDEPVDDEQRATTLRTIMQRYRDECGGGMSVEEMVLSVRDQWGAALTKGHA